MKITKLIHSCLLVETERANALFDPGNFSKEAGLVQLDGVKNLDYLIITHNHADHLDEEFVEALVERWPDIQVAANEEIRWQLERYGLPVADESCVKFEAPHEQLPAGGQVPQNSGWHFGELSHPGDSLSFDETKKVLALPYVAPWGSATAAVELTKKLKPRHIVPIHDWHLSDEARIWYRGLLESSLEPEGIQVLNMEDGTIEV